jgi:hypothetical protein
VRDGVRHAHAVLVDVGEPYRRVEHHVRGLLVRRTGDLDAQATVRELLGSKSVVDRRVRRVPVAVGTDVRRRRRGGGVGARGHPAAQYGRDDERQYDARYLE